MLPMTEPRSGYLELILGPMFSGKTTRLIERYRAYTYIGKRVITINYSLDTRYSDTMLSSHDRIEIPCIFAASLMETTTMNAVMDADVVLINEGQFFSDLVPAVKQLVEDQRKDVYVCGLDGDFRRERFGTILDLVPFCDRVEKLAAFCAECRNGVRAIFSDRVTAESSQVVIGSDNYRPLCRGCYMRV
jgi:thymidine kinase